MFDKEGISGIARSTQHEDDEGKTTLYVGRETELREIGDSLLGAAEGQGSVIFIEGHAGMGKTRLLKHVQEQAGKTPGLEDTMFLQGKCAFKPGTQDSSQDALRPFTEILDSLRSSGKHRLAEAVFSILKETGPDWLRIIPVYGDAAAAGIKTATAVGQHILNVDSDSHVPLLQRLSAQYVETIGKITSARNPLALVIEDAHWIDGASCELLVRLGESASEQRLTILVAYRPSYVDEQHPLYGTMGELEISGRSKTIRLTGWSEDEIQDYVTARFGSSLDPMLIAWLDHLTEGHPLFVSQYLSLLQQASIIRPDENRYILEGQITNASGEWHLSGKLDDEISIPDRVEAVLQQRIRRLLEDDQKMLELGSVQGQRFMSSILVDMLKEDELEVLSRLDNVEKHHRIIAFYNSAEWVQDVSDVYAFEHVLMQQEFYKRQSEPIRMRRHRQVGQVLERVLNDHTNIPRKLILDVARHYELGKQPLLAARYYFQAAQSTFFSGAVNETIDLCYSSLRNIRDLAEDGGERDKLCAEAIQLLLLASETRWRGKPELQDELPLNVLIEEAEVAAARTGDQELSARVRFLHGEVSVATRSLAEAVQMMREALHIAQTDDNPLLEFEFTIHLGNILNVENMAEGMKLLYQAYDLYKSRLAPLQADQENPDLESHVHRLKGFIGVGEFDRGNFDEAITWLEASITSLRDAGLPYHLPRLLNYLGQVLIATGQFETAEATIGEAIELLADEVANPWKGYNLALLGKLYLEWERVSDAVGPIQEGWQETQSTWNVALVPMVRNFYAELLMNPGHGARDMAEADLMLDTTVKEARASNIHNCVIDALSLRSKLALMKGNRAAAVAYGTEATDLLQRFGTMVALREEEVYFNHYCALEASGKHNDAQHRLIQAHTILQEKAKSLKDKETRQRFLRDVSVSHRILESWQSTDAS